MMLVGVLDVPGVARSARAAREFLTRLARRLALINVTDDTLADLVLCVDELVANACEHTASGRGGRVVIYVETDGRTVRLTVRDDGGALTEPRVQPEACGEGGRGLWLVEALSTAWGSHDTSVWAEFPCCSRVVMPQAQHVSS
ncbi:ATP-binding protein [Actinomadura gamaensis]|uniref:ATP-binding protein n=1 Tax=Actinomadura gamaensis TaxID=1763541 RepID=A0ABV9TZB2_9ACTN